MVKFLITDRKTKINGGSHGDVIELPKEDAKAFERKRYGVIQRAVSKPAKLKTKSKKTTSSKKEGETE